MTDRQRRREARQRAIEYIRDNPWCGTEEVRRHLRLLHQEARSLLRYARQQRLVRSRKQRLKVTEFGAQRTITINLWHVNEPI